MQTAGSMEKSQMLGKIEGRRRGHQRMRWLDGITDAMDMNLGNLQEMMRDREPWRAVVHRVAKSWTQLGVWTTTTITESCLYGSDFEIIIFCQTACNTTPASTESQSSNLQRKPRLQEIIATAPHPLLMQIIAAWKSLREASKWEGMKYIYIDTSVIKKKKSIHLCSVIQTSQSPLASEGPFSIHR